jgi:hypothetical protein
VQWVSLTWRRIRTEPANMMSTRNGAMLSWPKKGSATAGASMGETVEQRVAGDAHPFGLGQQRDQVASAMQGAAAWVAANPSGASAGRFGRRQGWLGRLKEGFGVALTQRT